ncbi:unnamed protein product [Durusdinium trenchii]|uniref:Uncharacterized protein n=1 Tax=Durusdinium trenchii TaxID=1381693 RepID=A0ABP0QZ96_9DINO
MQLSHWHKKSLSRGGVLQGGAVKSGQRSDESHASYFRRPGRRPPGQRLYELAKENENKPVEAKPEAVTSGDTVLEGMLNDLLAALRKEQPQDPLSKEKVDQATAAAEAEVKKTETVPSPTSTTGPLVAAEPDQPKAGYGGPSAGLLAAVQRASEMIKGVSGRAWSGVMASHRRP